MAELETQNTSGAVETTETVQKEETTPRMFTQEEVDDLLQKYSDKRVSQALKTAERKTAEKVKEAEKLARMNESEKFQYELEQREKAIAEKEAQLALAENKNVCAQILSDKGISLDLVNFVVDTDAEVMNANIQLLDKAFKASVKLEVEKRLGSSVPRKDLPLNEVMTQEKFNKLSLSELAELQKNNPEVFSKF